MMAQEPWCKLPKDWADLTDWQLLNLYYLPALKRQQQSQISQYPGLPQSPDSPQRMPGPDLYEGEPHVPVSVAPAREMTHPPVDSPDFKPWFIRTTKDWYGSAAAAEAAYEEQLNEFKYAPVDAWWRKT